jgi:hypothetical protein
MENKDTILPAGRFNIAPFGPTGVINNNSLDTIGQGLKKAFSQPIDTPRQFSSGPENQPKGGVGPSTDGGGGGGTVDLPTITVDLCVDGEPRQATIYGTIN